MTVTKEEYENARRVLQKWHKQVEENRKAFFKKSLEKYDHTYWHYQNPNLAGETIYLSVIAMEHGYQMTRFIKHTNSRVEMLVDGVTSSGLETYLKEFTLYPSEYVIESCHDKEMIFRKISHQEFVENIDKILASITISDQVRLRIE